MFIYEGLKKGDAKCQNRVDTITRKRAEKKAASVLDRKVSCAMINRYCLTPFPWMASMQKEVGEGSWICNRLKRVT